MQSRVAVSVVNNVCLYVSTLNVKFKGGRNPMHIYDLTQKKCFQLIQTLTVLTS